MQVQDQHTLSIQSTQTACRGCSYTKATAYAILEMILFFHGLETDARTRNSKPSRASDVLLHLAVKLTFTPYAAAAAI